MQFNNADKDSGTGVAGGVGGVYCEKFVMIDLTADAESNIKKWEPIPLSPCICINILALPIPNFNCPFIILK